MKNYKLYYKRLIVMFLTLMFTTTLGADTDESERKRVLEKLRKYPYLLAYAKEKYKDDKALVTIAIKQNGRILEYASKRLQDNEALVSEAVASNGGALAYASKRLQDDDDIVSIAIDSYGTYLEYASKRLRDDDDIVMDALRSNGANLEYASKRLRADKWYVSLAVKNNSSALEYASKALKNDKNLVLLAVATYSSNLSFASATLQDDKSLVLEAVKQDGRALRYVSKKLKDDKEVVALAIEKDIQNLAYASKRLQKLFGHDFSKMFSIEFDAKIKDASSVPLGIKSTLPLKQIAIIQNRVGGKVLLGKYQVAKGQPVDYYTSLNLNKTEDANGSITIIALDLQGKKHLITKSFSIIKSGTKIKKKYASKEEKLNAFTEQKYKRYIIKLRMKDEMAYGAFMVMHPMFDTSYIEHVIGKIDAKVVFDFYCSAALREDPFFRFTFNAPKKSGKLEIIVTDNQGEKRHFYKAYEI